MIKMEQDNPCRRPVRDFSLCASSIFLESVVDVNILAVVQNQTPKDKPIPICNCVSVGNWLLSTSWLLVRIDIELDEE
jgi:hypothetical protein